MLSVVYAVLLTLGNPDNLTPQGQWRVLAAPWLGEPPAGLQVETIRAGNFGDCPVTVSPSLPMRSCAAELLKLTGWTPREPPPPVRKSLVINTSSRIIRMTLAPCCQA